MELSYNWLLKYLPQPIALDELSTILTSIGLEVEHIEKFEAIKGSLEGLVIGEVLTCEPHPNADKLKVTTVNVGNDTILPIVCGAPNVAAGQKVIVATVGTTVHPTDGAPFEIKKAKIRGEVSEGMICADDEIGLGTSHDGIKVLPNDVVVGIKANEYFSIPAPDYTISIGLTPNRSDANSHLGVAKDVCAYQSHHTGTLWNVVNPEIKEPTLNGTLPIQITVEDAAACPLYAGITIANVKIAPSPEWLQEALKAIGQRPINNIVDITNYVLHETGQPLHAFDYDTIDNHHIIVKKLAEGTKFKTLDEQERTLRSEDLMINDTNKALAIAGVFGGLTSGITDNTTNVFLESAYFDPKTIRRTSMHHGFRTDAATHFEKSVDISWVVPALKRAAQLIVNIAGGNIASEVVTIDSNHFVPKEITFSYDYIYNLCGKNYGQNAIRTILQVLGFEIVSEDASNMTVKVPSNKADVHQAADIAEEILRIDGLDNVVIPDQLSISINSRKGPISRKWRERIANHLTGIGFTEILTNSISNSKYYPEFEGQLVKMLNSLTVELDCMRPAMLPSGLEVLSFNINRKQSDLKVYEIGNVYSTSGEGKYNQKTVVGIWLTGNIQENHWNNKTQKADIFYTKGIVESIIRICGVAKYQLKTDNGILSWNRGKDVLATAQLLEDKKAKEFDIKQAVYYAEVNLDILLQAIGNSQQQIKYKELPKYPAVKRDLAVIVDKGLAYEALIHTINKQKFGNLQNFDLFDVFESEKIGADKKSLALTFTFLDTEKTLTDTEIDKMMQQFIQAFEKDNQALIRQ
jgi:phenylalanyl-tRNA synthetase beta chain